MPRTRVDPVQEDVDDDAIFERASKAARKVAMDVLAATLEDLGPDEASVIAATLCSALTMNVALQIAWETYKEHKTKHGETL